jgi:putative glutathione S-transferase
MTQTDLQHLERHQPALLLRSRYSGRLLAPRSYQGDSPPDLFVADPGRFRLFADRASPWSQRSTLVIDLAGLTDAVPVSYVDSLADVGEAVSVPMLWDDDTRQVVSNDPATLEIDLATELREWSTTGVELYPLELRDEIDELDRRLGPAVNQGVYRAAGTGGESARARIILDDALGRLDRRLGSSRYLLGDRLTLADLRLWVTLVRYDAPPGGIRRIGPGLSHFRSLWAYAQDLYEQDAFGRTTPWSP